MIIGVTGFKRSGKDSVCNALVSNFDFIKKSFDFPIKEIVKIIFLWDDNFIENCKEEIDPLWGISPGQALQHLETDWAQKALCESYPLFKETTYRNLWVNRLFLDLQKNDPKLEKNYCISDVRSSHEVAEIKKHNGIIIKVKRNNRASCDMHESEQGIKDLDPDFVFLNTGTLNDLSCQVIFFMKNNNIIKE